MTKRSNSGYVILGILLLGLLFFPGGWVIVGLVVIPYGVVRLIHRLAFGRRRRAAHRRNVGADHPLNDARPDVLYLRCFHTDARSSDFDVLRFSTEEEDLRQAVRPLGDLIAMGQPGESVGPPGAARWYCPQDEWKNPVRQQMRVARLVIIRAGQGDGLLWECEEAFRMLAPHQLVILVLDIRATEYQHFATDIHARLGVTLPAIPRFFVLRYLWDGRAAPDLVKCGFIVFSEGWRAQFVPIRPKWWLEKPFREALRPVFAAHGVSEG